MSEKNYISEEEYLVALKDFVQLNVQRNAVCPTGFSEANLIQQDLCRKARELMRFKQKPKVDFVPVNLMLSHISTPRNENEKLWVSGAFKEELARFVHTHLIYWREPEKGAKALHELAAVAQDIIYADAPSVPQGDCVVWHRSVAPEIHPMPTPKIALKAQSGTKKPQVYFISGATDYLPASTGRHALLPKDRASLLEFDIVSQWVKKKCEADIHYIQQSPVIDTKKLKNDPSASTGAVQGFINRFILPDIATRDEHGKWQRIQDIKEVQKSLSRHTFVGYCYGAKWLKQFESELFSTMIDLGYKDNEINAATSCLGMVSIGYRPKPRGDFPLIPNLSVCNVNDSMVESYFNTPNYDFSTSTSVSSHKGITHGWDDQTLHIESAHGPHQIFRKRQDGSMKCTLDPERHELLGYAQVDEKTPYKEKIITTYTLHPCASLIRNTIERLVQSSEKGIRNSRAIIEAQRKEYLNPDTIDASVAYVSSRQNYLATQFGKSIESGAGRG